MPGSPHGNLESVDKMDWGLYTKVTTTTNPPARANAMAELFITVSRAEALNGLTYQEIKRLITEADISSSVKAVEGVVNLAMCAQDIIPGPAPYPIIRILELDGEGQGEVMEMIDFARYRRWPDQIAKDIIEGSGLPNDKETYVWY